MAENALSVILSVSEVSKNGKFSFNLCGFFCCGLRLATRWVALCESSKWQQWCRFFAITQNDKTSRPCAIKTLFTRHCKQGLCFVWQVICKTKFWKLCYACKVCLQRQISGFSQRQARRKNSVFENGAKFFKFSVKNLLYYPF